MSELKGSIEHNSWGHQDWLVKVGGNSTSVYVGKKVIDAQSIFDWQKFNPQNCLQIVTQIAKP